MELVSHSCIHIHILVSSNAWLFCGENPVDSF